ncbi:MAG TPA: hypothetical protein VMH48_11025 [Methylomirabilota bacterium]|nr:hypothetical protein [Methylomirabilota bacterium]
MKYLTSFKLPLLLLVAGAALLCAPSCKAQSEVSPDHFDGTDSWAVAQTPHPAKHKQADANSKLLTQAHKSPQSSTFQLAASREGSKPTRKDAVVVDRKRKTAAANPQQK